MNQAKMELFTAQKVNIICSEGDLLLRGAEGGTGDLLLVSSHVLGKASESFSRTFQTAPVPEHRSFAYTNEITLPNDRGDALLIICNILHGCDRNVPDTIPLDLLKAVAQTCNRHQLTRALLAWSPTWLEHAFGLASRTERYVVITIAVDFGLYPTRNQLVPWHVQQSSITARHCLAGVIKLPFYLG